MEENNSTKDKKANFLEKKYNNYLVEKTQKSKLI